MHWLESIKATLFTADKLARRDYSGQWAGGPQSQKDRLPQKYVTDVTLLLKVFELISNNLSYGNVMSLETYLDLAAKELYES